MLQAQLTDPRPMGLGSVRALGLIVAVAVLLRIGAVFYVGNDVTGLPGIYDQISYQSLAERVLAGHGFTFAEGHWPATPAGEPTAHWSFLYTLFLAAVYAVVGVSPIVARLIQGAAVGIFHTWLVYRLGRRVFGQTSGLWAALFSAIYVYFIYYAAGLLTEAFYFVGLLWTLDAAIRVADRGADARPRLWIELGLAAGLTCLLRQVFLLFLPVLFLWLWWTRRAERTDSSTAARGIGSTLWGFSISALIVVLLIAPWTARNYRVFRAFVPLNTNAGFALYWGNHPVHGAHFIPLLPEGETTYGELIPEELRALNEGQLDRALLRLALDNIIDEPSRFARLSISRGREYFRFWPSADSSWLSNLSRTLSFGLFLPLMVAGLYLALSDLGTGAQRGHNHATALLYLWILAYTTIHLLTWTLIRYRLPVDAVLLLFAAFAAARLGARFGWFDRSSLPGATT